MSAEYEHLADEWDARQKQYYGDHIHEIARAELIRRCASGCDPVRVAWLEFCVECAPVLPSAFVDGLRHIGHELFTHEVERQWEAFFEAMD